MGTTETIIVFAALMALIALVTVGIDWIGKPLKHRRFIPRIYRFEDEKLPLDAYGHATLDAAPSNGAAFPAHYVQPAPVVVATIPGPQAAAGTPAAGTVAGQPASLAGFAPAAPVAQHAAAPTRSAFSDSLAEPPSGSSPSTHGTSSGLGGDLDQWLASGPSTVPTAAATVPAMTSHALADQGPNEWHVGLALDTTIDDRKPSLATKAERFWKSTAESISNSHFDHENLERMRAGKAPRRTNPRIGRVETMQLTGLRQASQPNQVHMRWPGDVVDPWNAS